MFFKKRGQDVRKCPRGHILDPEWSTCPYCEGQHGDDFLDESRATHRPPPAPPPVTTPHLPPPLPVSPPPLAPPSSARPAPPPAPPPPPPRPAPPPAPDSGVDPDLTQISPSGSQRAYRTPLPPTVDDGSGPPPLVEWSNARGQPVPPHPSSTSPPRSETPTPPAPIPPPVLPLPPRAAQSLDEPTRILGAAPATGGLTVAWLVAVSGPQRGQDLRIQPGGARIGRLSTCGVCVPYGGDLGVSKEHAEVRIGGGVCVLVDLNSANGTFVNGERISERALQDGDRVRLGLLEFVFKSFQL